MCRARYCEHDTIHVYGLVAQGIEHKFPKLGVVGSNPIGVTI